MKTTFLCGGDLSSLIKKLLRKKENEAIELNTELVIRFKL